MPAVRPRLISLFAFRVRIGVCGRRVPADGLAYDRAKMALCSVAAAAWGRPAPSMHLAFALSYLAVTFSLKTLLKLPLLTLAIGGCVGHMSPTRIAPGDVAERLKAAVC